MSRITLAALQKLRDEKTPIATLTAYDASFAALIDEAGIECILIGDSLGMVVQGHDSTLPVTLDHMIYHTACVARGAKHAFIAADLPFGSYQVSPQQAFESAAKLMAAGANMVKIEGGMEMVETVHFLVSRGVPVWAHIGLQPQSVSSAATAYREKASKPRRASWPKRPRLRPPGRACCCSRPFRQRSAKRSPWRPTYQP